MAGITDIEADAFDKIVKSSDVPVVLEFWIRSCDFCRKFKPVYEQLPDMFWGQGEVPEDEHVEEHREPEAC